jgi:hypothetical protein
MRHPEPKHYAPHRGAPTPWGNADYRENFADGLDLYGTASRRGFRLSRSRERELDTFLESQGVSGGAETARMGYAPGWYEDGACAEAVVACFPEIEPDPFERRLALMSLRLWLSHPRHTGWARTG